MMTDWIWLIPPFLVAYGCSLSFPRWDGYGKDELKRYALSARVDPIGCLLIFILCRTLCSLCATSAAGDDSTFTIADAAVELEAKTERRVVPAAIAWFFGLFPVLFHLNATPMSEKSWDKRSWEASQWFGLWIFLTRWIIFAHAMYLSMSLYAEMAGGHFRVEMYSGVTNIAACCTFVSIQYYTLVHFHSHTQKVREKWHKRAVRFDFLQGVTHVPSIFLAISDIFFVKNRELVIATRPSSLVMAGVSLTFVATYIAFVVINYTLTRQWPYRMMDDRMTDLPSFFRFFTWQTAVFYSFLLGVIAVEYIAL
eukprot:m.108641 g.108641  ORF g.108641 m.108641 type:complete len:310 (-) comp12813_c0_seq5:1510-2439(-)